MFVTAGITPRARRSLTDPGFLSTLYYSRVHSSGRRYTIYFLPSPWVARNYACQFLDSTTDGPHPDIHERRSMLASVLHNLRQEIPPIDHPMGLHSNELVSTTNPAILRLHCYVNFCSILLERVVTIHDEEYRACSGWRTIETHPGTARHGGKVYVLVMKFGLVADRQSCSHVFTVLVKSSSATSWSSGPKALKMRQWYLKKKNNSSCLSLICCSISLRSSLPQVSG